MLWRFYLNITGCVWITIYWFEIIFTIHIKQNIISVKFFDTSFGSNILFSFTKFQYQGTDAFGSILVKTFQIFIQGNFLYKWCMDTSLKSWRAVVFGD